MIKYWGLKQATSQLKDEKGVRKSDPDDIAKKKKIENGNFVYSSTVSTLMYIAKLFVSYHENLLGRKSNARVKTFQSFIIIGNTNY